MQCECGRRSSPAHASIPILSYPRPSISLIRRSPVQFLPAPFAAVAPFVSLKRLPSCVPSYARARGRVPPAFLKSFFRSFQKPSTAPRKILFPIYIYLYTRTDIYTWMRLCVRVCVCIYIYMLLELVLLSLRFSPSLGSFPRPPFR